MPLPASSRVPPPPRPLTGGGETPAAAFLPRPGPGELPHRSPPGKPPAPGASGASRGAAPSWTTWGAATGTILAACGLYATLARAVKEAAAVAPAPHPLLLLGLFLPVLGMVADGLVLAARHLGRGKAGSPREGAERQGRRSRRLSWRRPGRRFLLPAVAGAGYAVAAWGWLGLGQPARLPGLGQALWAPLDLAVLAAAAAAALAAGDALAGPGTSHAGRLIARWVLHGGALALALAALAPWEFAALPADHPARHVPPAVYAAGAVALAAWVLVHAATSALRREDAPGAAASYTMLRTGIMLALAGKAEVPAPAQPVILSGLMWLWPGPPRRGGRWRRVLHGLAGAAAAAGFGLVHAGLLWLTGSLRAGPDPTAVPAGAAGTPAGGAGAWGSVAAGMAAGIAAWEGGGGLFALAALAGLAGYALGVLTGTAARACHSPRPEAGPVQVAPVPAGTATGGQARRRPVPGQPAVPAAVARGSVHPGKAPGGSTGRRPKPAPAPVGTQAGSPGPPPAAALPPSGNVPPRSRPGVPGAAARSREVTGTRPTPPPASPAGSQAASPGSRGRQDGAPSTGGERPAAGARAADATPRGGAPVSGHRALPPGLPAPAAAGGPLLPAGARAPGAAAPGPVVGRVVVPTGPGGRGRSQSGSPPQRARRAGAAAGSPATAPTSRRAPGPGGRKAHGGRAQGASPRDLPGASPAQAPKAAHGKPALPGPPRPGRSRSR